MKLRAWQKSLIAILITIAMIAIFGQAKLLLGLMLAYIVVLPTIYLLERKKKLSYWQERLIVSLMVFPILSFFLPFEDVLYLFLGSLIFTGIIIISERWKDKGKEIRPEWENDKD
jgi:chromate transport protein ChrA